MSEKTATQKPSLSLPVVVTTVSKIDGQSEHAAIITKVIDDDCVNVMVMPANSSPYPIPTIYHARHSKAGALSWRFPTRTRV